MEEGVGRKDGDVSSKRKGRKTLRATKVNTKGKYKISGVRPRIRFAAIQAKGENCRLPRIKRRYNGGGNGEMGQGCEEP